MSSLFFLMCSLFVIHDSVLFRILSFLCIRSCLVARCSCAVCVLASLLCRRFYFVLLHRSFAVVLLSSSFFIISSLLVSCCSVFALRCSPSFFTRCSVVVMMYPVVRILSSAVSILSSLVGASLVVINSYWLVMCSSLLCNVSYLFCLRSSLFFHRYSLILFRSSLFHLCFLRSSLLAGASCFFVRLYSTLLSIDDVVVRLSSFLFAIPYLLWLRYYVWSLLSQRFLIIALFFIRMYSLGLLNGCFVLPMSSQLLCIPSCLRFIRYPVACRTSSVCLLPDSVFCRLASVFFRLS